MLIIQCGLPRAGKSTNSKKYAVIISRDSIREELLGNKSDMSNEKLISKVFNERLINALQINQEVCIDNTNLKCKYIEPFIKLAEKYNHSVLIKRYFVDPITLYERAKESSFPIEVINRMMCTQEMYKFDIYKDRVFIEDYYYTKHSLEELINQTKGFDQHNIHHEDDLYTHLEKVANYTIKNLNYQPLHLLDGHYNSFLLHDIGKLMAIDKTNDSWTYFGHERASWYIAKCYEKQITVYPELILWHMEKFRLKNGMNINKWLNEVYEIWKNQDSYGTFEYLLKMIFEIWKADTLSHKNDDLEWIEEIIQKVKEEFQKWR